MKKEILAIWGKKKPLSPIVSEVSPTLTCGLMKQVCSYGYPYILNVYET